MENNQLLKIDKKLIIKRVLTIMGGSIIFALFGLFISYGKAIPVKTTLIVIGIFIVVFPISMLLIYRYRNYIMPDKIRKFFLVLGILTVVVNLALIIIEGGRTDYYLGIALGLYFISGPNFGKPKDQKLIEK
ncbi:MAG: hypothetical protein WC306_02200 [Candidatus Paceibacterota bacterium]|jgi:small-conductance mechanosensitive channel